MLDEQSADEELLPLLGMENEAWEAWLDANDGVPTVAPVTEDEMIADVQAKFAPDTDEAEDDDSDEEEVHIPTAK